MSVGLEEAARRSQATLEIALAIDSEEEALGIYGANLNDSKRIVADIGDHLDSKPGSRLTTTERKLRKTAGDCDILIGGPPCQGHSDLNNHTRRSDPRNGLYLSMARAAEVFQPKVVVVENVAPVRWDKSGVVGKTTEALEAAGYEVSGCVIDLSKFGVPQRRKRHILLASRVPNIDPASLMDGFKESRPVHPERTVCWAIGDLEQLEDDTVYNSASTLSQENSRRIKYLFENGLYNLPNTERPKCHRDKEHSYTSMYGRLRWEKSAQTITTGFGSMGQGRYVHPSQARTITPHEAARLQTFPDWFDFGKDTRRGVLAKVIGNAVAPLLMVELGAAIVPALIGPSRTPKAALK